MKASKIYEIELFITMLKRLGVCEYAEGFFSSKVIFKVDDNPHLDPAPTMKELIEKAQTLAARNVSDEDILFDPYIGLDKLKG